MALHFPAALFALAAEGGGGSSLLSVDATLLWATLVIFAVFAAVLAKFAWGPLLKIVDEREKQIRDQLEAAERAFAEARELLAKHQELLKNAGRERDEILARAMKEADALRAELVEKARAEGERAIARAREQIQRESEQAISQLRGQVADLAIAAASRIVQSSLTEDAQRRLVDEYIHELPRVQ